MGPIHNLKPGYFDIGIYNELTTRDLESIRMEIVGYGYGWGCTVVCHYYFNYYYYC